MSVDLVSRVIAEPEVNLDQGVPLAGKPSLQPRILYNHDENDDDQQVAIGRGIVLAVLLSVPIWVLCALAVAMIK